MSPNKASTAKIVESIPACHLFIELCQRLSTRFEHLLSTSICVSIHRHFGRSGHDSMFNNLCLSFRKVTKKYVPLILLKLFLELHGIQHKL